MEGIIKSHLSMYMDFVVFSSVWFHNYGFMVLLLVRPPV